MARGNGRWIRQLTTAIPVVCVCLAAACGGSSSSGASSPGATSSVTTGSTQTPPPVTGSSSGAAFCSYAKQWAKQLPAEMQKAVSTSVSAPDKAKAEFTVVTQAYQQIVNAAPAEIKPSLEVVFGDYQKFVQVLAANGYNFAKAGNALAGQGNPFDNAASKAALKNLNAWGKANHCTN